MTPKLITTLKTYSWELFRADVFAGVTVAMVAMPLSLAIAIASGADPGVGLVTAVTAGFLISLLGGSRVQIGGPTGAFIVVVYAVIAEHGYDGLVLAAFMAGLILLTAGYFRLGGLISFIPEAVIDGFTIGIAIVIAASQIKDLLGLQAGDLPAEFLSKAEALWAAKQSFSLIAFGVGVASMVLIVVFRRVAPKLPGVIVAIALMSFLVAVYHLPVDTIGSRFGELPDHLPAPSLPDISLDRIVELLPSAFVIAILAGVESLLSAMVADRMSGGQHRPNAELIAQGAANIGSSLFGGLPATGAIARTATNIRAGGRTPVAGIIHALTILGFMLFFAHWAGFLAMPALAGLLLLAAWNMSEPDRWKQRLSASGEDKFLLALTLVLTVLADLTIAIGVGVSLGLAFRMRRQSPPPSDWNEPKR